MYTGNEHTITNSSINRNNAEQLSLIHTATRLAHYRWPIKVKMSNDTAGDRQP